MIGPTLRAMRIDRGWTQDRLAQRLCEQSGTATVTRHEVSRWERGARTPKDYWLGWLATVLDVPLASLMEQCDTSARLVLNSASARLAKLLPQEAR